MTIVRGLIYLACLLAATMIGRADAHEMSMAEMEIRELSHGEFLWQWSATNDKRPQARELNPEWPEACTVDTNLLHCGDEGLNGVLAMNGVGKRYSAVIVKAIWLDGQQRVYTVTAAQPQIRFFGSADDRRGMSEIAGAYGVLGFEHILGGIDHLLFVFALLFLVGFNRQLLWTITAFTLAHSLTLALSALNLITLRSPPVEAAIALSIVLVAVEALHGKATLSRRWPAVVAFLFGLVHGLGFAGALKDIGLPENHLSIALLTFNLGVEAGQLLVVSLAFLVYRGLSRIPQSALVRTPALYAIGSVAAFWSIGRVVAIVS